MYHYGAPCHTMIKKILHFCLIFSCLAVALPAAIGSGKYKVIYAPKDALQCRIDLIEQAQNDILLSYYIIEDDVSGSILLDLLAKASLERGVKVKILMDKNGSKISKPMRKYMEESGVEIHRFFLKNLPGIRKYYHGLHEKVFIADTMMMVGGRNLKDEYYSLSHDFNFRDLRYTYLCEYLTARSSVSLQHLLGKRIDCQNPSM